MSDEPKTIKEPDYDLSNFQTTEILSNNTRNKTITLLGKFPDLSESDQAIVLLEKTAFVTESTQSNSEQNYFSNKTKFQVEFINNIYGNFQGFPPSELNGIKVTVIYPATQKHIEKYSLHEKHLVLETPALYENVTQPYIKSTQFSLEWVYNILDHKQEKERIIYEDNDPENGFVLLPDLKWDGHTIETFYALAIVHDRNIKSLRDLNAKHLPLLRNIRDESIKVIVEKYDIDADKMRVYIHYQPSFYHFHVHFNPLNNDAPGITCDKSHLIDTVINNIELMPDYYQKITLPFVLHDNKLLEKFHEQEQSRKRIKTS